MTEPGTFVGAACLGPAEAEDGLAGYGFYVEPGGDFILGRQDPSGKVEFLKQGSDARIETVERVSIKCVPNDIGPAFAGSTDVTVTGYANGLEVVTTEDPDGYYTYVYAGLTINSEKAGTEVRFTRVWHECPTRSGCPDEASLSIRLSLHEQGVGSVHHDLSHVRERPF
jgi:hypothetical protein